MKPKTFISYCAQDKALAQRLKEELGHSRCDPWQFELSAVPGTDAWGAILNQIENSDFFVVILSQAATASRPVQEEISHAHYCSINHPESKPRIIPLKIDDHIIVPRQIVRAVHLPFSELQFNSDFERLLHAMGVEQSPFGETTELDVTFSRGRVFDTKLEAGIFASNLIANHPQISAKFQKLSAKARFAAGGRWQMPSPQEIIWEAETLRASRQPQFVRLSNYKIVVVFALHCGYNGGYSSYERVVVEISASHLLKYDRVGEEGDLVLHSDTLSLKFEGFRAVTSLPLDLE